MSELYLMYLRKSRADGEDETVEEVLAKHERMLQKLAVEKFGHPIPGNSIYREVVSGETIEDRPEMKRVLSAIESPDVKGVLVVDPQRLSRGDWEDGGRILSSFKYSNTLIVTPPKTYNLYDQYDYRFFKMELSRGNDYLEYTKEILKRGRENSIEAGRYLGSVAPYGYEKVFVDKAPTLTPNAKEAEAINIAVRKCVYDGMGWTFIARELDSMGYKPRSGGKWNPYSLRDICINPVNIGKVKWNARKTIRVYKDGKLVKTRPRNKDSVIYKDGLHPPILEKDLYEKLIAKAGVITRENQHTQLVNPLAGLLYCSTCGRAMTYRTYKRNGSPRSAPRLACDNQINCGTKSSTFSDVYNILIDILENTVHDFEFKAEEDNGSARIEYDSMISEAENELRIIDAREEELYDYLEEGLYSKEIFLKRMSKYQDKRSELEKRLSFLRDKSAQPVDYHEKIRTFRHVIDSLNDDNTTAKHKNNLLKQIIKRIEYSRNSENRTKWDSSKPELKIYFHDF